MRVAPISCYRPSPEAAGSFASLPYDVFDRRSAAAYVAAHPDSFLAIDRPETAFPPDHDMYAPEVYERARALIRARAADGTLLKDESPCIYLYRLVQDGHAQVGVVAACSIAEYEDGTIRRHENTRPTKTEDRSRHILACGAQTGPVLLAYRDSLAVDVIVDAARTASPLYDFTDEQGVRQTVWRVARPAAVEALCVAFSTIPCAYVADGHHRASAAARVARERRAQAGPDAGELPSDSFLAVLFPASQLRVMAYNRVVSDCRGLSEDELVRAIGQAGFSVGPAQRGPVVPEAARRFGLYAFGAWRELRFTGELPRDESDPAAALDASLLQDHVLAPVLGISDPATDGRISFVGGIEGTEALERGAGAGGAAFTLCPTSVDELMAVSDAGALMPPKSTWFEPKLRSGLFVRRI